MLAPLLIDAVIVMGPWWEFFQNDSRHESRAAFLVSIFRISGISKRAGRGHLSAICVSLDLPSHSVVFDVREL